jgi:hypothetical protein
VYLWMEKVTTILGLMTAIGAFLTMLLGFIYWLIKLYRYWHSKHTGG